MHLAVLGLLAQQDADDALARVARHAVVVVDRGQEDQRVDDHRVRGAGGFGLRLLLLLRFWLRHGLVLRNMYGMVWTLEDGKRLASVPIILAFYYS